MIWIIADLDTWQCYRQRSPNPSATSTRSTVRSTAYCTDCFYSGNASDLADFLRGKEYITVRLTCRLWASIFCSWACPGWPAALRAHRTLYKYKEQMQKLVRSGFLLSGSGIMLSGSSTGKEKKPFFSFQKNNLLTIRRNFFSCIIYNTLFHMNWKVVFTFDIQVLILLASIHT
jgi:hypothetical protein